MARVNQTVLFLKRPRTIFGKDIKCIFRVKQNESVVGLLETYFIFWTKAV